MSKPTTLIRYLHLRNVACLHCDEMIYDHEKYIAKHGWGEKLGPLSLTEGGLCIDWFNQTRLSFDCPKCTKTLVVGKRPFSIRYIAKGASQHYLKYAGLRK